VALPEVLVGFLKANRSRWSKKIRPQRGALNEGSRPSDRLLMKYSCKEWLYLSIHPSILPTTFPHFLLLPSTILWCASFEREKKRKQALFHWHHKDKLISTLSEETLREFSKCMV